jgi:hypothetical protein
MNCWTLGYHHQSFLPVCSAERFGKDDVLSPVKPASHKSGMTIHPIGAGKTFLGFSLFSVE